MRKDLIQIKRLNTNRNSSVEPSGIRAARKESKRQDNNHHPARVLQLMTLGSPTSEEAPEQIRHENTPEAQGAYATN